MPRDPLSDTLALIDARCVVSGGFTAGGTWGLRFWPQAQLKLVAVARGSLWLSVDEGPEPVLLRTGDVAVVNGWRQVVLADDPQSENADLTEAFTSSETGVISVAEGEEVAVVGGHVEVNRMGEELLLAVLPQITCIRAVAEEAHAIGWLLQRILREMTTNPPGSSFVAHQHAQLLLAEVFRAYLADVTSLPVGWLRVIAEPGLGPALRAMHADPGRDWSLAELARLATMSRTTFIDRFKATAGVPPMTYLQQWRIRLAERELGTSTTSVTDLAAALGYKSNSAFSTAFKAATGLSPRHFREAQLALRS
ncbi:AraC family transcriptional regulator [Kineosporia sp. NBRC 101731]|uniref:AraC family transcriptional regulator n=1 Tax=Kineosporia sp. NBRC 101731 TaxID=3032199 RepID=UPI0024A58622|nr:AraC family transcriptional regulator [Kineosporia sp. NBRC 101731]GLY29258.1 AraC family transcriptional regulator [Kineosporia sp. NBRC 101731]